MSSSENFNAYSRYYDLLYKDKNYTSEANYVVQLIKANHNTATQILRVRLWYRQPCSNFMQRKVQCYWVREKCRNGRACQTKKNRRF
ncbi:MAG: hypothetical protein V9E96_09175 [Chitinophagaceae bacterium]